MNTDRDKSIVGIPARLRIVSKRSSDVDDRDIEEFVTETGCICCADGESRLLSYVSSEGIRCRIELMTGRMVYVQGKSDPLILKEGEVYPVRYSTSYGTIDMDVRTDYLRMRLSERSIFARAEYRLFSGGELLSKMSLKIHVNHQENKYRFTNMPIPGGGYVTGLVFHKRKPGVLYARTDIGGTYRYDMEGRRWHSLIEHVGMKDLSETFPIAIALDDSAPERLYIACGDGRPWWGRMEDEDLIKDHRCGVLCISEDRGKSFRYLDMPCYIHGNLPGRGTGPRLVVSETGAIYFASQRDGLLISCDGGKNWTVREVCGERYLTLVWTNSDESILIVGTAGISNALRDTDGKSVTRGHSLYVSYDRGESFEPLSEPSYRKVSAGDEGAHKVSLFPGLVAERLTSDEKYIYVTMSATGAGNYLREMGYSCDSGDATGGRVLRYRLPEGPGHLPEMEDITPERAEGELDWGFGGIDTCASCPGLLVVATLCRGDHDDILYLSSDYGVHWERALHGLETGNLHINTSYMKPEYNGGCAILHWMSDVKIDPFDPDTLFFTTGIGVFKGTGLTKQDRSFADECSGIEETVHLNLYSPPAGPIKLVDILGDLGGFAFMEIGRPCENSFADDRGNRYITCLNADIQDSDPATFVVSARGNWSGATKGGVIVTHDGGKHFKRLPLPYGLTDRMDSLCQSIEQPNVNPGWTALSADGSCIVFGLAQGNELPADCIAVTYDEGEKWEQAKISAIDKYQPLRLKVFSDRMASGLFYGFDENGRIFVSTDSGRFFLQREMVLDEGSPDAAKKWGTVEFGLVDCADHTEIRGDGGYSGRFLIAAGDAGLWRLFYDSIEGKCHVRRLTGAGEKVYRAGFGRHPEEPGYLGFRKSIYLCGEIGGVYGFFRSDDDGETYFRIGDDGHRFGEINSIEGDSQIPGRFYIGTGSLGVLCVEQIRR